MKKLAVKIPIIHIVLLMLSQLIVQLIITQNTQEHSELYKLIYSLFFMFHSPIHSYILGFLLTIPVPLLLFSIIKRKKPLIIGFSISTLISVVLLLLAILS